MKVQAFNGFSLKTNLKPSGDQPKAIAELLSNLEVGVKEQVLLGATGTGKTFTIANVIEKYNKPTLIIAHNKILAAQLYRELKELFPENAVEYFISYYDYYQPEAYIPEKDLYIEKDASINEILERYRHSATVSVLERRDVIVVASVSCIYGLGSPEAYYSLRISLEVGQRLSISRLTRKLVEIGYERNDYAIRRATFSVKGNAVEIVPSDMEDQLLRIEFWDDEIDSITLMDALNRHRIKDLKKVVLFPASHYIAPRDIIEDALEEIEKDLKERVEWFKNQGRLVEAQRLYQRTMHDIEMIRELGHCKGIENYSRYFDGRRPGEPPYTLLDYFPEDFLLIVDESHVTVPQIRAMYNGDRSRKEKLVEYGWRLPSALDNRPLKFEEFLQKINQVIYMSATPGDWEVQRSKGIIVEQIVRPTGLLDPVVEVRPTRNQLEDLIREIQERKKRRERALVLTTTKRLAEEVSEYLNERGIKAKYMHSDLDAIERAKVVKELREGSIDVIVGVNLLREGLDLPEVSLVAILEADKEGFLRSYTSLIQTIGRAARNINGKAILYADRITESMKRAIEETNRRRQIQERYNQEHGITPKSIVKPIKELLAIEELDYVKLPTKLPKGISSEEDLIERINKLEKEMWECAKRWEFEKAAKLRDEIKQLRELLKLV
jgi:excinuclease ABC subunit B